jgi:hypothetical protein
MIARTTAIPAAAYRVGHEQRAVRRVSRRTWNNAWLLLLIVVVGLVATRYARSLGLLGVIAPVLGILLVVAIVRLLGPWMVSSGRPAPPPAPRDVTPREPSVAPSPTIAPRPTQAPVVIVEPATEGDDALEAKLATLDRLRADGRLTDAEYEAKRAQLIADF